jgi:hypothetical protein
MSLKVANLEPLGRLWYVGQQPLAPAIEEFSPSLVLYWISEFGRGNQGDIAGHDVVDLVKLRCQKGEVHVMHRNGLPALTREAAAKGPRTGQHAGDSSSSCGAAQQGDEADER